MSHNPTTVVHVRIPERIRLWLDARAEAEGRLRAAMVRRLLEQLEQSEREEKAQ